MKRWLFVLAISTVAFYQGFLLVDMRKLPTVKIEPGGYYEVTKRGDDIKAVYINAYHNKIKSVTVEEVERSINRKLFCAADEF